MIRSWKLAGCCVPICMLLGLALPVTAGAAEAQHKWKVQNLYGPNTSVYKDFQAFAARVKEATNGAVDILNWYSDGTNIYGGLIKAWAVI